MNKRMNSRMAGLLVIAMFFCSILPALGIGAQQAKAEQLEWKFDFGTATSPVLDGYVGVHDSLLYSEERGYGLSTTTASRYRTNTGEDDMAADFVLGPDYAFIADIPNGEYDVTVYSGDLLAGTSTTNTRTTIDGVLMGTISTRQAVANATYRTEVKSGQLRLNFSGSGVGGYVNGVVIRKVVPMPPAVPQALTVSAISSSNVTLQWTGSDDAASYNVHRSEGGDAYTTVATVTETVYTDLSVTTGSSYSYRVSAVGGNGMESEPSEPVTAIVEAPTAPPAAPENLAVGEVEAAAVQLSWSPVEEAQGYAIFRSASPEGDFAEIGTTSGTVYTDTSADTSAVQYYVVKAYNEVGFSEASNVASSPIYYPAEPLPSDPPYRFDFGSGELEAGYLRVAASTAYTAERKYGFADPSMVGSGNRNTGDPLRTDFAQPAETSFIVDLPNGDYSVTFISGDAEEPVEIGVVAETIQKIQTTSAASGEYIERTFEIALVDGQLNFEFTGSSPKINGLVITKLPGRAAGDLPTVYIAGDSTVQTYDEYWKPEAGWGQMIPRFFNTDVTFDNHAIGGRSSKSFIFEGRLDAILREIKPGDYFLVQFGHNDATISRPERYASVPDYKNYLKTYVNGARQRGATPILVTPVGRRDYNSDTGKFNVSFPEYVQGMKEVAEELSVDLVDLSTLSVAYYDSIGPEGTLAVFLHTEPGIYQAFPNGSQDNTHFQEYGAIQIARLVSGAIQELGLPLSAFVANIEPPANVPDKPAGVTASNISNAGAQLTWDAVEGADIYKVYRKLASDENYALIGTATIPQISMTGMSDGQTYHVVVSAVNGKGESELSDVVVIKTKEATIKFDFGLEGNPVAEGYTEVNLSTLYTPERGYGIVDSTGMIGRDRGTGGDLLRDWLGYFSVGWSFNVDVPNGLYSVKVYVGDFLGSARSTVEIEGYDYGQVSAPRSGYTEKVIPVVSVKDGQMNFRFAGSTGIVNGLEITPILASPSGIKVDEQSLDPDQPFVTISWDAVDEAVKYNVYRRTNGTSQVQQVGSVTETAFTDSSVDVGMEYVYTVTTVDAAGTETVPSVPFTVALVDPSQPVPDAPVNLEAGAVNKNDITLSWDPVEGAVTYNIYRSKKADGTYEWIGKTRETTYTDDTVLTTIPYYYKVAAVNAGGVSEMSETLETPAVTVLKRQMERLNRSLVAVRTEAGVYIGWRMLGTDPEDIGFNLYRDNTRINTSPITASTNFVDAEGTIDSVYEVRAVINGVEKSSQERATVWSDNHFDIPLQKPQDGVTPLGDPYTYRANDASVGDLDGDGQYEIIVKWDPSNSKDNSQAGYTGNVYLDAYKMDGTLLWRIDMGRNIRAGAHYTQFMVYDLDGDGRAEIAMKTADGTIDGTGAAIGDPSKDFRTSSGYILSGPEYLTIFEGLTGQALATTDYDPPRGIVDSWGDGYGNRVDRLMAAVAYLDGERPSLIMTRGIYTRSVIAAYNWRDGELSKLWTFDSTSEGNSAYAGQGYHSLSIADVDADGKDEVVYGQMVVDDDGTGLYSTGLGHGDALHVSDLLPERPGLEVFAVQEDRSKPYGYDLRDAATGEIIWGVQTGQDTGRGVAADIDPRYRGAEAWAISGEWNSRIGGLYSAQGEKIGENIPTANFAVWWDGDLLRELLDHQWNAEAGVGVGTIDKWDYGNAQLVNLLTADGTFSNNYTKGTPALQADLFGDWREEAMWRTEDSSALRIYTTTDVTEHRIFTLMHDPTYRLAIAWQNVGYNQPPHPGFFLGHGMAQPPMPNIYTGSVNGTDPNPVDGGYIQVNPVLVDGKAVAAVTEAELNEAIATAEANTIGIRVNGIEAAGAVEIKLPAQPLNVKTGKRVHKLVFDTGLATVMLDANQLGRMLSAEDQAITFSVSLADSSMTGGNPVYDFDLYVDGDKISDFTSSNGNAIEVTVPYMLESDENAGKIVVYYLADNGELIKLENARYNPDSQTATFKLKQF
ncbi:SGNH/GDSL hydrolase family protein [Paenibacillus tarimensis]